jgi:hypothetical protein
MTGKLHENIRSFVIISRRILLRMRNALDTSFRGIQNTHFMFNIIFKKSCLLLDNVEKHGRTRQATNVNIARSMRFVCWVTKATDTHSYYEYSTAFPQHQWLHQRA